MSQSGQIRSQYYGTREIRAILGIGKTKATEIMHIFEARGQLYRVGNRMKIKDKHFQEWLQDECRTEI